MGQPKNPIKALYDSLASLTLAQPATFVASGPSAAASRRGRVDVDEAAYLERHKNMLKPSGSERTASFVKFVLKLYLSASLLTKLLVLSAIVMAFLVLLPALVGVALTVANSMSELVRLATIALIFVAGILVWVFAPI